MPYSSRYIMDQLARGRPLPQGRPEDELRRAIQQLNHHDVDRALRMGARPGLTSAGLLLDSLERMGPRGARPATWSLRALCRGQVLPVSPLALGRHLERAGHAMPSHTQDQIQWWQLWERISRSRPSAWTSVVRSGKTPLEVWTDNACDPLRKAIQSRFPRAFESPTDPEPTPACHTPRNRP